MRFALWLLLRTIVGLKCATTVADGNNSNPLIIFDRRQLTIAMNSVVACPDHDKHPWRDRYLKEIGVDREKDFTDVSPVARKQKSTPHMKKLLAFALCFVFVGCAAGKPLTPQYFEKVIAFPTTFSLPNSEAEAAWGRAKSFVAQYSIMQPHTYLISYGYDVSRTPMGDKTQFTVQCISDDKFNKSREQENACILAYYMATGELDPRFINR